jgi:CubicO group peptidase (beta-lactamase class C family)
MQTILNLEFNMKSLQIPANIFVRLCMLVTLAGLSFGCYGQAKQFKKIAREIDELVSKNYVNYTPGCALLVSKHGEVILEKGYGIANLELQVPMRPEMVFRIGSITKQFTAVAILQLIEEGKLHLSDSIQKFISTFDTKGKKITIENLLTHTSGIKGYEQLDAKIPNAVRIDFHPKLVIDSLSKLPLDFAPGTAYAYSNSNYYLLGFIIEIVTGISYQRYVKDNLIDKAGLVATYYENTTQLIPNRANGYFKTEGTYRNSDFISMSLVYSAGALRSNVRDLYKWHRALYDGKIIKKESFERALKPNILSDGNKTEYGFGYFIKNENGISSVGHGGAIDGFRAIEMYYPEKELYITLMCNSESENFEKLYKSISDIAIGVSKAANKEFKLSEQTLDSYTGLYRNEHYNVTIKIYLANGRLYGDLSNGTGANLMFMALTDSTFILPDIQRIKTSAEFVQEKGKVTKVLITQEAPVEFIKL